MPEGTEAGATLTESTEPAEQATAEQAGEQTETKPTETVDYWKQKSRENEKRAKANADAADRLAKLEDANKSEAERGAERLAAAEADARQAKAEALRFRIATRFGISDEDAETFLTGSDEESLSRQAERLVALSKPGTPRPDPSQGATSSSAPADMNAIIRRTLRGGG